MSYKISVNLEDFLKNLKALKEKYNNIVSDKNGTDNNAASADTTETDKDNLKSQIDEITKAYEKSNYRTYDGYKVPVYKKTDYSAMTDDEIKEYAKNLLEEKQNKEVNDYIAKTDSLKTGYEDDKKNAAETAEKQKGNLVSEYDAAKQSAENQALKRGLGRSSVITKQLENYDNSKISDLKSVDSDLSEKISETDEKIDSLEKEKTEALDNYKISQAAELQTEIDNLKTANDKKVAEAEKYNNELAEKESESMNSLKEKGIDTDEKYSDEYKKAASDKVKAILNYYGTMSAADALKALDGDKKELFGDLPDEYFYYVKKTLKDKTKEKNS